MKVMAFAKQKKRVLGDRVKASKTFSVQPASPRDVARAVAYLESARSKLKADRVAADVGAPYERGVLAGAVRALHESRIAKKP